ncbi:MAG: PepSY domain-containing protein [Novosphingobium sp.]
MRKYHRWLSVLFALFLFWIAVTGLMIHVADIKSHSDAAQAAQVAQSAPGAARFACPPDMICRPKPDPNSAKAWVGYLQHLHSGESFGPLGTAISMLSGLALLFFSFSGLWMYIQMWRARSSRNLKPGWFWK